MNIILNLSVGLLTPSRQIRSWLLIQMIRCPTGKCLSFLKPDIFGMTLLSRVMWVCSRRMKYLWGSVPCAYYENRFMLFRLLTVVWIPTWLVHLWLSLSKLGYAFFIQKLKLSFFKKFSLSLSWLSSCQKS